MGDRHDNPIAQINLEDLFAPVYTSGKPRGAKSRLISYDQSQLINIYRSLPNELNPNLHTQWRSISPLILPLYIMSHVNKKKTLEERRDHTLSWTVHEEQEVGMGSLTKPNVRFCKTRCSQNQRQCDGIESSGSLVTMWVVHT